MSIASDSVDCAGRRDTLSGPSSADDALKRSANSIASERERERERKYAAAKREKTEREKYRGLTVGKRNLS